MPGEETILARRQRLSQVPRACEGCKVRKIRCDRTHPCGNCRASGIACQQAVPVPEIRPKADRVGQLEEYVATLEARLAKLELRLGSADPATSGSTPLKEQPCPSSSSSVSPNVPSEQHLHDVGPSDVGGLYEGSSSFLNQSVQASQVAQRTATIGTPEAAQTISESLGHLESLLRPGTELRGQQSSADSVTSSRAASGISLLPVGSVIAVLRRIKTHPSMFLAGYAIIDGPLVEHLCQRVYFPAEPASIGHVTSVNGILYLLLREYDMLQQSAVLGPEWDVKQLLAQAKRNFDLGIQSFDLLTVPSFENVLALTISVIKAHTDTKPVLCRALVALACSHCQMLGYHREITHQKDRSGYSEIKRRLFWMLYVYEKLASLLLGHAAKVQDFDIDARHPTPSSDPAQRPWDNLFSLAIRAAKIQGQIYDHLYSAAALLSQPAERKRWINTLSAEAYQWRNDFDQWDASKVIHFASVVELSKIHWDITYYSTLTSLLRAPEMPGVATDISAECFQAARLSLQSHLRCFTGYGGAHWASKSEYINWALHNSSFTPFVVIFLHSIAASSLEDVQQLDQVVETLLIARDSVVSSEKSERLHEICATFARLARRMVEAPHTSVGMYDQNTDSLQLAGVSEGGPLSWAEAFTQPPSHNADPEDFSGFLNDDMSSVLADWINGQPPATDMFGMDFGQ